MKPYCHMGKMCIGCSPQLIEGICPDSKAGRTVAELFEALENIAQPIKYMQKKAEREGCRLNGMAVHLSQDAEYLKDIARAAIAKATGGEG
jgi:hypothetical protein